MRCGWTWYSYVFALYIFHFAAVPGFVLNVYLRMYQYFFQAHELLKQKNLEKQGLAIYFLKFWSSFCLPLTLVSSEMSYFWRFTNYFYEAEHGSIAAVVQNGKMNFDREAKTGETSEGSQEQSDFTMRQTSSNAIDAIHNVSTQFSPLQRNFVDTSAVPSLFKEFMTKLRSSLKSQSNLSLLLVTIFALIFFMQVCSLNQKFRFIPFIALLISHEVHRTSD